MARTAQEAVDDSVTLFNLWVNKSATDNTNDDQAQWIIDFDTFNNALAAILASASGHPNGRPTHPPKP